MSDQANLDNGGNNDQNNGGTQTPAWMAQLPGELQGNERFTSFATIGDLGKTFLDLEGKSKDALFIPGENATDEEKAEFYAKLGRPESADKYTFTKAEGLDESIYNDAVVDTIRGLSFKLNLSDAQATALHSEYAALLKQGYEAQQQAEQEATDKAINALKDEWKGEAFKANSELASRAFKALAGGEEAAQFIEDAKINGIPIGNHPTFLKMFHTIATKIGNDSLLGERGNNNTGELSDEEKARARFPNTYKK